MSPSWPADAQLDRRLSPAPRWAKYTESGASSTSRPRGTHGLRRRTVALAYTNPSGPDHHSVSARPASAIAAFAAATASRHSRVAHQNGRPPTGVGTVAEPRPRSPVAAWSAATPFADRQERDSADPRHRGMRRRVPRDRGGLRASTAGSPLASTSAALQPPKPGGGRQAHPRPPARAAPGT